MGWNLNYNFRDLTSMWNANYEIMATYNSDGIRTSKNVIDLKSYDGYTINYILDGKKILQENRNGVIIKYLYDIKDSLVGFIYNNITYRYLKNAQNDVIGIVDNNNNVVVKYFYNAYGELIDLQGDATLGNLNPFRYRSYYYDVETGWYYLNSRYYNPKVGRFINSDDTDYLGATGTVLSYNLFSYCENNPVNNIDPNGNLYISLKQISRILLALGANPIGTILFAMGISAFKKLLIKFYTKFLAKWVMLIPTPILKGIVVVIGGVVGLPFMSELAVAIFDSIAQKKDGINIYIKKTWFGFPYGIGVDAV